MAVNNRDLLNDHDASSKEDSHDEGFVYVYDRRSGDRSEVKVSLGALFDFDLFRGKVKEVSTGYPVGLGQS